MSTDFAMPDLGEGLTESELVAWHVSVGELVELNQPIGPKCLFQFLSRDDFTLALQ